MTPAYELLERSPATPSPDATTGGSSPVLGLLEKHSVASVGWVAAGDGESLFHQVEVDVHVVGMYVTKKPVEPVPVGRVRLEADWRVSQEGLQCLGSLHREAIPPLGSVDPDEPDPLLPPVDREDQGIAVDNPNHRGALPIAALEHRRR